MRFFTIILIFLSILNVCGQAKLDSGRCVLQIDGFTKREVYLFKDGIPRVAEGQEKLREELGKLKTPKEFTEAIQNDPSGKIIVAFIVETDGTLSGKRVVKNIHGTDLGDQLLKLIDNVNWIPEKCNGRVVPTLQVYPVLIHIRQ